MNGDKGMKRATLKCHCGLLLALWRVGPELVVGRCRDHGVRYTKHFPVAWRPWLSQHLTLVIPVARQ